jgi:hypothetical protein
MGLSVEGSGMKHNGIFSSQSALPDAPMAMPKQTLERRDTLISTLRSALSLRSVFSVLPWF